MILSRVSHPIARITRTQVLPCLGSRRAGYSSLHGKVIAISGAASGIGLATAKHLYSLGARLSLADNRQESLDAAVPLIRQRGASDSLDGTPTILAVATDVRFSQQVDQWIEETVSHFGALDGAVNLAGVVGKQAGLRSVTQLSNEGWKFVTDINLNGLFYSLRAQLRAMEQVSGECARSIVNAGSTAGLQGNAFNAEYSASKHGVIGLTRSAAKEFGRKRIRVNAIAPGPIDTPMVRNLDGVFAKVVEDLINSGQALGRPGKPEEVARTIAFLLSDDSSFITGTVLGIDGGQLC